MNNNCNMYDAYIFGSSRAAAYKTEFINSEFNSNSYNYSVSDETVIGIFNKLKWLIDKECIPKNIIIEMSPDRLYNVKDYTKKPYSSLLRLEHPLIADNLNYSIDFAINYLYSKQITYINIVNKINPKHKKNQFKYNIMSGDVYYLWDFKFPIQKCISTTLKPNNKVLDMVSKGLIDIKFLAEKFNIQVHLILSPQPFDSLAMNAESLAIVLNNISKHFQYIHRIPFFDQRLLDDKNYHDHGHPKDILAKEIISSTYRIPIPSLLNEIESARFKCNEIAEQ